MKRRFNITGLCTPQRHYMVGLGGIKNLKLKIRPEPEHQYNSPWNIAVDFDVEMDFSVDQIAEMLQEYETDHQTGMEIRAIAEEIYSYTSGYPVLVSTICKYIDEKMAVKYGFADLSAAWTKLPQGQGVSVELSFQ